MLHGLTNEQLVLGFLASALIFIVASAAFLESRYRKAQGLDELDSEDGSDELTRGSSGGDKDMESLYSRSAGMNVRRMSRAGQRVPLGGEPWQDVE